MRDVGGSACLTSSRTQATARICRRPTFAPWRLQSNQRNRSLGWHSLQASKNITHVPTPEPEFKLEVLTDEKFSLFDRLLRKSLDDGGKAQ
jgi:hypothetical protein